MVKAGFWLERCSRLCYWIIGSSLPQGGKPPRGAPGSHPGNFSRVVTTQKTNLQT